MKKIVDYKVASTTHTGYVRERNEDALFVSEDETVFAVADGMGGMAAGDLASKLAVIAVAEFLKAEAPDLSKKDKVKKWIAEAIDKANGSVVRESFDLGLDMGTTIVVACQTEDGFLCFGHLGDSRIYSSVHGCLTEDHAVGAHELTNFAGRSLSSSPDLGSYKCQPGSRILLCTDGLNKAVSDEEIQEVMQSAASAAELAEILVDLALGYGGPDNITMIALDYI